MRSIKAASVEDLPDPVPPVTRMIPLRTFAASSNCAGRCSELKVGMTVGMTRITIAQLLGRAQHAGEQNRRRGRARPVDALEGNRNRGIPRSSHSIRSQLSALTPQGRNVVVKREKPM